MGRQTAGVGLVALLHGAERTREGKESKSVLGADYTLHYKENDGRRTVDGKGEIRTGPLGDDSRNLGANFGWDMYSLHSQGTTQACQMLHLNFFRRLLWDLRLEGVSPSSAEPDY